MPSKNKSNQPEKYSMQNEAKNLLLFSFFSNSGLGKIFLVIVLDLFTQKLSKNAKL